MYFSVWVSDGPGGWRSGVSPSTPLGWAAGSVPPNLVHRIETDTLWIQVGLSFPCCKPCVTVFPLGLL